MRIIQLNILSIAGFDPSGGAGILSDTTTFHNHGISGFGVCTAITVQNESVCRKVASVHKDLILDQISVLIEKYPIGYIKIGLIDFNVLCDVLKMIKDSNQETLIVWDPILRSSSGYIFNEVSDKGMIQSLLEKVYLVTPNLEEVKLLGFNNDIQRAIEFISASGCNLLLKGGHNAESADDILVEGNKRTIITGEKIEGIEKHGTGCTLSAAIICNLSMGYNLETACRNSKMYTRDYILGTANSKITSYGKEKAQV